ncbi:MAG: Unknown protein [uncultured Thiotrichaceae bacterium]|uniref:DUF3616 domain-containing protein n=1 Tax=uncultured Thiotrichaceae bacterium TaxID=298394 RepID=A0A6S6TVG0_9GAMM|nr:MAG: Unknown protein [uncultured Thiotrichaceae bacterium]
MKNTVNYVLPLLLLLTHTQLHADTKVLLQGEVLGVSDISAVEKTASFLVIGSDEAVGNGQNIIQLFKPSKDSGYELQQNIALSSNKGKELDIEGLTADGDLIYVVGSHSSKRRKVKSNKKYKNNQERFYAREIENEENRDWLYRVQIDDKGREIANSKISLRKIIKKNKVLEPFSNIPSKENGIDIEGLASKDGWLYLGFRGPVFRKNYVPIMKLKFDQPEASNRLLYVQLNGAGIRSITAVSNGFLIIAGPVGDAVIPHQLYFWDGKDMVPGKDRSKSDLGRVKLLAEIPFHKGGKAEGLAVLHENASSYDVLLAYDGVSQQESVMQRLTIRKLSQ